MTPSDLSSDLLLRAEIRSANESLISYARELTRDSIFVVTDWRPPLFTEVRLRISFPSLVDPVEVPARVTQYRSAAGVGSPAGIHLAFSFGDPSDQRAIDAIVDHLASQLPVKPRERVYRVLLVEDNAFIRDMFAYGIAKFFSQQRGSVEFEHAPDARAGWEKLGEHGYDLVIVDYYLPAEDGATFIARLRQDPRFMKAPVVAISVGGNDARDATISAGADLFLDKPVVLRDLFRTLQVLSQRGALA
jgi:CheY-like chemotaxis protein